MSEVAPIRHPVVISQVMVNFAAGHGVDLDTCLLGTGLGEAQLLAPDGLIERDQELRLVENLILALPHVPALGFELGLQYRVATFGPWGFVLRTSRSLREAIATAIRYLPLSTAYCRFASFGDERTFGVVADAEGLPPHLRPFLLERDMATAIQLFHELGLAGLRVQRLEFQGPAPDHAARIEALCGLAPQYGCARNAVVLRREDVDRPLPMYDLPLSQLLEAQCRAQLERRQSSGLAGQVRQLLLGPLGLMASIEAVAQQLSMAPRSLRRRLEDEQTSFRELVDLERRQLAAQLLDGSEIKLDVLALQLGYSDTASFTRAFRRWFGCAPGEYRRRGR